ncbi:MAG: acyl-CoA dehydrogenase [bacterium]|nr:acyl-CoA dehydrogenase [bacterium]MBK7045639.1 acyl-CoA dehydrogenase [bacterium]MBK7190030.1 acyl-CoA dehydrogenase [bacterium]MBK7671882.1 acyl-CoA dehydrogenase [bacterium]MBK7769927.1 acyl-CoA dehydrogenase [bacterium]
MQFQFNEQQRMIRDMARDFTNRVIVPVAAELDATERFPKEIVKQMGELGLLGMNVEEQYGGAGLDTVCYVAAMEEVSRGCASCGVIMSVNNSLVCWPLETYGNEDQKQRFLKPLAAGQKLGAYCLSEPGAGTDAAAQRTVAKKDGDHWVLNGMKNFITNGANADILIVFAQTDAAQKHKGIRAFIVETTSPGFSVIRKEEKMGIRASDTAQLAFDNVIVPDDQVLGPPESGFRIAMSTLDGGRIGIASQALGISAAAYEASRAYSKQREQFGRPICDFQAIQWKIADMATRLEAARLLTYRAAWAKDQGGRYSEESAMAKLFASEASHFITNEAVQIFGGNGYSKEYPVERHFRDAKITEIYEGTSEAQRMVISSLELKK